MSKYHPLPDVAYTLLTASTGTVLLQTSRFDAENYRSFLFADPVQVITAFNTSEVNAALESVHAASTRGLFAAGYASYECGPLSEPLKENLATEEPLLWFGIYERPLVFDHRSGLFNPKVEHGAVSPSVLGAAHAEVRDVLLVTSQEEHARQVAAIHEYISAGDTYQVNLTTKFVFKFAGSPAALFRELQSRQRVAYSAFIFDGQRHILSLSPELFFRIRDGRVTTRPMKGTAPRGRFVEEDASISAALAHDAKNRSENVMIVDLLRNDLGRVCEYGSVTVDELFEPEKYDTLWQMTSTLSGKVREGVTEVGVFKHLFPCGSVTGAPKLRTMEIIRKLEQRRRGVYTGAIGYFGPNGESTFNVAIRTVVLKGERGEMGVGSGIVIDSDAALEYAECELKANFLTHEVPAFQLIETIRWEGDYELLDLHMERLALSAQYFDFSFERDKILTALKEHARAVKAHHAIRVRVLLDSDGELTIESAAVPTSPVEARVLLANIRTSSRDRFLFHKTTHRELYDRVYGEAARLGCEDAIFMNERGEITEGAISNVFVQVGCCLFTPPVDCGLLPGTFRRHILDTNPNASEKVLSLSDLASAEALYICNSIRGLRKVTLQPAQNATTR